jgi:DNA (cytosine-5)-methyltransferase 1
VTKLQTSLFDDVAAVVPMLTPAGRAHRAPAPRGLILDYFAGGGGVSHGIEQALGRSPDVAINHCAAAVAMHKVNHPTTMHYQMDVWDIDPKRHLPPGQVDLAWFSPSCTHHSRARGNKPVSEQLRGLAWVACLVAEKRQPKVIVVENVVEFREWGPVKDGLPIKTQKGETYREFCAKLRSLGYVVEDRVLNAADFGAPTMRKRLILIARSDGQPIVWPEPSHGPGRPLPYRTAASCINWTAPSLSIFATREESRAWARENGVGVPQRPLAEATMARIAEGLRRYVIESPAPFVVPGQGVGLMVQTGYGEAKGQAPRCLDVQKPLGTIVASGAKHAVVTAWLTKFYGGVVGHGVGRPLGTITTIDHHGLVQATLQPVGEGHGDRAQLVAGFITKYYQAAGNNQSATKPLGTIVCKDRFGVVTVAIDGTTYAIVDISLRMMSARELASCQGFDADYQLTGTHGEQIARIGNSVAPPMARAIVAANLTAPAITAEAA